MVKWKVFNPLLQDRSRTSFTVGDACSLPDLGKFGCVFAANLICRLPEPADFYSRLPDMIVPGGLLFITSPYTWLETYTEKVRREGGLRCEAFLAVACMHAGVVAT